MNYIIQAQGHDPRYNLAVEAHLMTKVGQGDVILYLWQNDHTIVIGKNQNVLKECRAKLLEEEGGYVARRTTGGGAVYQDMGNVCFTYLASSELYDVRRQTCVISDVCREYGIDTEFSGRNDILTKDGLKFSGNAYSKTTTCSIQHGTLMVDVDTEKMNRYLTPSKEKMKAKGIASVRSRVCNLIELNPDITTEGIIEKFILCFQKEYGSARQLELNEQDLQAIEKVYEKYCSWDWVYGKSPVCEICQQKRFDWGEVELRMNLEHLIMKDVKVYTDALDVELPEIIEKALQGKRYDLSDVGNKNWDERLSDIQKMQLNEVIDWITEIL